MEWLRHRLTHWGRPAAPVEVPGPSARPASSAIRFPTLTNTLLFLLGAGVEIGTVLDVGTHTGSAPLQEVFPHLKHVLFEPVDECYEELRQNYAEFDYELVEAAVTDNDGDAFLRKYPIDDSEQVFCEIVYYEGEYTSKIRALRLDSFCAQQGYRKPYLLKVAVDGHEEHVLRGAEGMLEDVAVVIVDAGCSNIIDRAAFLRSRGFTLFDITDSTYYKGILWRFDLVFLTNTLCDSLQPPAHPVDWSQWMTVTQFDPNQQP
jgi:FkbM family methyltransferase